MTSETYELLNAWESYADVGSVMVIVGVAGEGVEIAVKFLEKKNERLREWYERHELSIEFVGFVFWVMVVVGLGVEWRGNHKSSGIKEDDRARLTTILDATTRLAGQATERAAVLQSNSTALQLLVEQIRSNNLPINQPISDISGQAVINCRRISGPFWQPAEEVQVGLFESSTPETLHLGALGTLSGTTSHLSTHRVFSDPEKEFVTYAINLSLKGYVAEDGFMLNGHVIKDNSLITVKRFMDNIDTADIILKSFPKEAELLGGGVEVLINGTFKIRFKLLSAQNTDLRPSTRQASFNRVFLKAASGPLAATNNLWGN